MSPRGMFGKKHKPETIEKMRLKALGRKYSPETYKKIVETRKKNGSYEHTDNWKKQQSEMKKGIKPKNLQQLWTKESNKKRSNTMKEKSIGFQKGHIPFTKGKTNKWGHHTQETRNKISAFLKGKPSHNPFQKGEKHWAWKGGITPLNYKIRNSEKYHEWRLNCMQRDNFTCQGCQQRGHYLEVHHIHSFSKIMEENNIKTFEEAMNCQEVWDVTNGVTVCLGCHQILDKLRRKFSKYVND